MASLRTITEQRINTVIAVKDLLSKSKDDYIFWTEPAYLQFYDKTSTKHIVDCVSKEVERRNSCTEVRNVYIRFYDMICDEYNKMFVDVAINIVKDFYGKGYIRDIFNEQKARSQYIEYIKSNDITARELFEPCTKKGFYMVVFPNGKQVKLDLRKKLAEVKTTFPSGSGKRKQK